MSFKALVAGAAAVGAVAVTSFKLRSGSSINKVIELTEEERNAKVQDTWKLVEANLESNGVAFFKKIFEIAPGALQLFSFKDESNLYESPKLKAHAVKVMKTVGVAVAGLQEVEKLIPVLKSLGKKHVDYGVVPEHYDIVGQALLATLEAGLGHHWTPEVKKAWTDVYGTVASVMKAGAEEP